MKNVILAIMATYIFYTDLCVVKIPVMIPLIALVAWVAITELEDMAKSYLISWKRGKRLKKRLKSLHDNTKREVRLCGR